MNSTVKNKRDKDNLKSHQHVGKGKGSVRKKTFPFVKSCNNFRQSKRDRAFPFTMIVFNLEAFIFGEKDLVPFAHLSVLKNKAERSHFLCMVV